MAANIINRPRAVAMSVYVIRAFVKMREGLAADAAIFRRLAEIDKTLILHDGALRDIYQKLRPLLEPPPAPPKPEIGFHVKEEAVPYRVRRRVARQAAQIVEVLLAGGRLLAVLSGAFPFELSSSHAKPVECAPI